MTFDGRKEKEYLNGKDYIAEPTRYQKKLRSERMEEAILSLEQKHKKGK